MLKEWNDPRIKNSPDKDKKRGNLLILSFNSTKRIIILKVMTLSQYLFYDPVVPVSHTTVAVFIPRGSPPAEIPAVPLSRHQTQYWPQLVVSVEPTETWGQQRPGDDVLVPVPQSPDTTTLYLKFWNPRTCLSLVPWSSAASCWRGSHCSGSLPAKCKLSSLHTPR